MSDSISATDLLRPRALRRKIDRFVETELWREELPPLLSPRGVLLRLARYLHMMVSGSRANDLRLLATSLTYSSLISLVPLLALLLAVFKGLGYDSLLSDYVAEAAADMPEQVKSLADQVLAVVNKTNFAQLGGIGAAFLLFMIVQMLSRIEDSFNRVWGIVKHRTLFQKITNYISVTVIVPILLLAAITFTAQVNFGGELATRLGLLKLAPFAAVWLALSFLYQAMPNTRVRFTPAMVSGFFGAVLFHFWLRFYILIQPGVSRYNLLYGTLAAVPIFLAWLFVTWMIVLLGAKVAYAVQNGAAYQVVQTKGNANLRARLLLAVAALVEAARAMTGERPPLESRRFAADYGVNPLLFNDIAQLLAESGMLAEVAEEEGRYALTKAPELIAIKDVRDLLLDQGDGPAELGLKNANRELATLVEASLDSVAFDNRVIADLARAHGGPSPTVQT